MCARREFLSLYPQGTGMSTVQVADIFTPYGRKIPVNLCNIAASSLHFQVRVVFQ